jgi:hypothetical protein
MCDWIGAEPRSIISNERSKPPNEIWTEFFRNVLRIYSV